MKKRLEVYIVKDNEDNKYIYDKIFELKRDAENKINIGLVIWTISTSLFAIFFSIILEFKFKIPNSNKVLSIIFYLFIIMSLLSFIFSFIAFCFLIFALKSRNEENKVKKEEIKTARRESVIKNKKFNKYNYMYWISIKDDEINDPIEIQIRDISRICNIKFKNFNKFRIWMLFSIIAIFLSLFLFVAIFLIQLFF